MAPSHCATYTQCIAIVQNRDFLCMYEILMWLRLEFETVRAQLLHQVTPPPLSGTLALVIAEKTRLWSLDAVSPPVAASHSLSCFLALPAGFPFVSATAAFSGFWCSGAPYFPASSSSTFLCPAQLRCASATTHSLPLLPCPWSRSC